MPKKPKIITIGEDIKDNRMVVQSHIMASAKFKYTLTENRIRIALLDNLRKLSGETEGMIYKNNLFEIHKADERIWHARMAISEILKYMGDGDYKENYTLVIKSARSMQYKIFEVMNPKTGEYWGAALIMNVKVDPHSGVMDFYCADWVLRAMLNFTKGFNMFEYQSFMGLTSSYSMRMYELVSKQSVPLIISVEKFKQLLGIEDVKSYDKTSHIRERILDVAKAELDEKCPYSFEYKEIHVNPNNPKSKIISYQIIPKRLPQNEKEVIKQKHLAGLIGDVTAAHGKYISQEVLDYMQYGMGFTSEEINANKVTILAVEHYEEDILLTLARLKNAARLHKARNFKAYVMASLKNLVAKYEDKELQKKKN